jgi:integrase
MFKIARDEWGVPINEKLAASLRLKATDRKRNRRLRSEELDALLKSAKAYRNPVLEKIIRFAVATGMRRGEILSIRREHVDVENRRLSIPLTKNGYPRAIPLSRAALAILETTNGPDIVFPIKRDALRLAWDRIIRRANIDDLRFHDLRHEAISRFFELGLTIPEVASISGHRDATMLFRYAHASETAVFAKLNAKPPIRRAA